LGGVFFYQEDTMKKILVLIVKCGLPIGIYMVMTMLGGALFAPLFGVDLSGVEMPSMDRIMTGMLTTAIIQSLVLILVAYRSRLDRVKTALLIGGLFFILNHVLNIIESLIFMRNLYPVNAQFSDFFNGMLVSAAMGLTVAFLWVGKNSREDLPVKFNWSGKLIGPWIKWILLWFVIYFFAGLLIPMNAQGVYEYYFAEGGAMNMSLVPLGYLMQIPRGSIWILLSIGLYKNLKGTDLEKQLITGLTFGCIMSSSLLIPNFLMPGIVRLSHLPEILFANLLWGFIISRLVSRHFSIDTKD
jgi:hypothetical protein